MWPSNSAEVYTQTIENRYSNSNNNNKKTTHQSFNAVGNTCGPGLASGPSRWNKEFSRKADIQVEPAGCATWLWVCGEHKCWSWWRSWQTMSWDSLSFRNCSENGSIRPEVQQLDHTSQRNLNLMGSGQFYRACVPPIPLTCKESGSYHLSGKPWCSLCT